MNGKLLTYALLLGGLALARPAPGLDLIDHKPHAELIAALKASGHVRIAQGSQGIVARDTSNGELFTTRSPLMLTTNKQTGEWTVSVFNNKEVGSVRMLGTKLQRVSGEPVMLPTFDRRKAVPIMAKFDGYGPCYYPDEAARLSREGFRRIFTGTIATIAEPIFRDAMQPVFFEIVVRDSDAWFAVFVVDSTGACAKLAMGDAFSDKP